MGFTGHERRQNPNETGTLLILPMPRTVLEQKGVNSTVFLIGKTMRDGDNLRTIFPDEQEIPKISDIPENRIIIGGSTYSINENLYWIEKLKDLVRYIYETRKTLFGICFGHQLIASAFGANVEKGGNVEFEIGRIDLTPEGRDDPIFNEISPPVDVFQTHGYVVTTIPCGSFIVPLASSRYYHNQALAIGPRIRTVQFHPEMNTHQYIELAKHLRFQLIHEVFGGSEAEFNAHLGAVQSAQPTIDENTGKTGRQILRNFYRMAASL